jgi:hypothetical protein
MYRVEKRYQVPSLQVESYQQVLDLLTSNELDGFDTIVIDTLGKLIDRMGEYVTQNNPKNRNGNGQLTQQGWGQVKNEFHALITLINGKNKSVVFVAHEKEEKEGDVTKKRPDVPGSAGKDVVKELDFMGYMEMSGNKRTISFSPSGAYYAKNSMGLDSIIEIPEIQAGNSFIKDVVVSAIRNRREQDAAQAGPYDEVIGKIDAMANTAKDLTALNEAYTRMTALNHIWDSKLYAKSKIRDAAKALNATWDKAASRFIGPAVPKPEVPTESAALPPKSIEQQCHDEIIEITNILKSEAESGERYFTLNEYNAVNAKLAAFPKNHPEFRLYLVSRLLDEKKEELMRRIEFFDSAGAGENAEPGQPHAAPEPPQPGPAKTAEPPPPREQKKPDVPSVYEKPEGESSGAAGDGFVDDIPDDIPPKRPPGRTGGNPSATRSLSREFQNHINNKHTEPATAGDGGELDIF